MPSAFIPVNPVARPPPLLDTNIWGLPLCFLSACVDWIEDRCCGLASSIEPPPLLARVHRVFSPLWLVDLKRLTSNRSFCFRDLESNSSNIDLRGANAKHRRKIPNKINSIYHGS